MVNLNAFLDVMEGFVDAIQEFLVARVSSAIQEPDLDATQIFFDAIQVYDSWIWLPRRVNTRSQQKRRTSVNHSGSVSFTSYLLPHS